MEKFISCDWGTSVLRLRVVDIASMNVVAETLSQEGISATYELWKQRKKNEAERMLFYQSILIKHIIKLEKQCNASLQNTPLIISGMASSNLGMMQLAYREIPFSTDGSDLQTQWIRQKKDFPFNALLISGAKTSDDVMRGEETQLIGCLNGNTHNEQLFIFPGTHSKHIRIKRGRAVDFTTYVTGEFFALLTKQSTLSGTVEENEDLKNTDNLKSFERGVADSNTSNVLHSCFLVRTNFLLGKLSKKQNYHYLSGLLIGSELQQLKHSKLPVTLVSNERLKNNYVTALTILGFKNVFFVNADAALVRGQYEIYKQNKLV